MPYIYIVDVIRCFIDGIYVIDPRILRHASIRPKRFSQINKVSGLQKTAILAGVAALVAGFVLSLGFYSISAPNESIASRSYSLELFSPDAPWP
jgi:hypothetical protein